MDANQITEEITNYLNSYNDKSEEFNKAMSREHRTLQQNFTRLCLKWLEHVASDEYYTDGRNEQSKDIAQKLLGGFKELQIKEGYTGRSLEMMSKPSGYLGTI
jgi:hypothetical protein